MKCIEKCLGLKWDRIEIKRTKGRKPFVSNAQKPSHMPNFNFNVSHEGDRHFGVYFFFSGVMQGVGFTQTFIHCSR